MKILCFSKKLSKALVKIIREVYKRYSSVVRFHPQVGMNPFWKEKTENRSTKVDDSIF